MADAAALLKEILKEVKNSNKKVAELEKKLQDLQEAECSRSTKRKKIAPSPEVRVSCHSCLVNCSCYLYLVYCILFL